MRPAGTRFPAERTRGTAGMTPQGVREIRIRRPLIQYYLRLMQIDPGRLHETPQVQQIVLLTPKEALPLWD